MSYICKTGFSVPFFDDDGHQMEEDMVIEVGDVFEKVNLPYRIVGGPDTVRLQKKDGTWLETTREHFEFYFEEEESK